MVKNDGLVGMNGHYEQPIMSKVRLSSVRNSTARIRDFGRPMIRLGSML
jgi:hypothetical protein